MFRDVFELDVAAISMVNVSSDTSSYRDHDGVGWDIHDIAASSFATANESSPSVSLEWQLVHDISASTENTSYVLTRLKVVSVCLDGFSCMATPVTRGYLFSCINQLVPIA